MSPKFILTHTIVTRFANSLSGLVATRRRIITASLIVILLSSLLLLLVACGGGGTTPPPASTSIPAATPTTAYKSGVNYTYDNAGRLTQVDYPNGVKIIYTYDKAGNLISQETKK